MSSQNEENEFTHTPRGVTSMKKVIRAKSKNVMLPVEWNTRGQPLNNKGENILVSYIGVLVRQNVSIKFCFWTDVRLNSVKDRIWEDITVSFQSMQLLMLVRSTSGTSSNMSARLSDNSELIPGNVVEILMGTSSLHPPAKYANLIDEADSTEFVTLRTQYNTFLKVSEENRNRASKPMYPYRVTLKEKSRLNKKGVAWARVAHLEAVRSSLEREDLRLSERVRSEFLKWAGFSRLSENPTLLH
ncbi:hypothetical protein Lal_00042296 [Lupinus albus]|nr:hypothetical protein Lal_00042296 [Lupinus albus]